MRTDHPFQPGARVAVDSGWTSDRDYREAFVEKVYSNGNFILKGDKDRQQYSPSQSGFGDRKWTAHPTSRGYSRVMLRLWDESTDAEIRERIAETSRRDRIAAIRAKVERLKPDRITEAQLDQIEAALP